MKPADAVSRCEATRVSASTEVGQRLRAEKESKATQLLKMAGAAVSGQKPEMGVHREMGQPEQETAGH